MTLGLWTSVAGWSGGCADDDAVDAGSIGGAQDRAQVARFFDAFDQRQEERIALGQNAECVGLIGDDEQHAAALAPVGHAVQRLRASLRSSCVMLIGGEQIQMFVRRPGRSDFPATSCGQTKASSGMMPQARAA